MDRRRFISTVGLVALSGCTNQYNPPPAQSTQSTTPTSTQTPTSTPTPTEKPVAPEISYLNLLSVWDEYGDVLDNRVNAVGAGANAVIGLRYSLPVHDGKSEEFVQVTVYHNGPSVASRKANETRISGEGTTEETWERWFGIETADWDVGTYTAEAIVRDEISGRNSAPMEVEFEVVDPLRANEVELIRVETPPSIQKGEQTSFTLHLKNVSDRDSSIVSTISARYEDGEWQSVNEDKFRLNIPAGESRIWESGEFSFDYAGTYEYRLDSVDTSWTLTVSE